GHEQRGFRPARRADHDQAARVDAGAGREPDERPLEVLERDPLERRWQPRQAEVGEIERRIAVRGEQLRDRREEQASLQAAEEENGRLALRAGRRVVAPDQVVARGEQERVRNRSRQHPPDDFETGDRVPADGDAELDVADVRGEGVARESLDRAQRGQERARVALDDAARVGAEGDAGAPGAAPRRQLGGVQHDRLARLQAADAHVERRVQEPLGGSCGHPHGRRRGRRRRQYGGQRCRQRQDGARRDSSSSRLRSSTRRIFPLRVFGSASTNSISRGYLYGAVTRLQCSCSSPTSVSARSYPVRRTTNAFTIWPRSGSGFPTTALSATAGCSSSALSTSNGPIRYAAERMTSSARPVNHRYPSSSRTARSPVTYQSPR